MNLKAITCAALVTLSAGTQAATADRETITYKNERGSVLTLHFTSKDTLSGTFTTAVASKECQQAIGNQRPVIGYIVKNAITISVDYPACGSVLAFIGNIEQDKATIDVTAILAHQSTHIATQGPGARFIGHDVFKRV
ncbi:avidin/streptavidin family protein [Legionella erythra]|uniref:Avidin family protein n=1 Tax=Legionella erythra TaxID=448 RepID=A0A0W0TKI0_LEGER|nr:avidin/streptavidin family protein [Legionella erythra]KTC96100.1 Avidin family protein [Legionella erythra]